MNTFHQEPRHDCMNFAPCGIHSLSKCRKYKGTLKECAGCALVRRKSKTVNHSNANRKVCPHCHQEYNLTMYGKRKIRYNGNEYVYYNSWCKLCTNEASKTRYRNKVLERLKLQ